MKNFVNSNRLLKLAPSSTDEFNVDLDEWGIIVENDEIENSLKIVANVEENYIMSCDRCSHCGEATLDYRLVLKKRIKIVEIWEDGGYTQIDIKNFNKKILSQIIEKMREMHYHNQLVCARCIENFVSFKMQALNLPSIKRNYDLK